MRRLYPTPGLVVKPDDLAGIGGNSREPEDEHGRPVVAKEPAHLAPAAPCQGHDTQECGPHEVTKCDQT